MKRSACILCVLVLGGCGGAPADRGPGGGRAAQATEPPATAPGAAASAGAPDSRIALPPPPDDEEQRRICAGIRNSYLCAQAIERRQLERTGDAVRRVGGILSLSLASGREMLVPDDTLADWPAYYSFLGYEPELDYYVLHAQHPEGNTVELVHRGSGWRTVVDGVPRPAPGGRRIAIASWGIYNANVLAIYRVVGDTLEAEWTLSPEDWAPEQAFWIDSLSLGLVRLYAIVCERADDIPQHAMFRDTARVWLGEAGWEWAMPSAGAHIAEMEARYPGNSCRPAYPA